MFDEDDGVISLLSPGQVLDDAMGGMDCSSGSSSSRYNISSFHRLYVEEYKVARDILNQALKWEGQLGKLSNTISSSSASSSSAE